MNSLYNISIWFYVVAVYFASLFNSKAKLWINGRKNIFQKIKEATKNQKNPRLRIKAALEEGKSVRAMTFDEKEAPIVAKFQLITYKPVLYLCNVDEASVKTGNEFVDALKASVKDENAEVLVLAVGTEADINELDDYDERHAIFG